MQLTPFSSDDLKQHKELDTLLSKAASWNLSTAEAVTLYRSLVWFASIRSKIEASIMEITKVTESKDNALKDGKEQENNKGKHPKRN